MVHWTWLIAACFLGWIAGFAHAATRVYKATTKAERDAIVSRLHP